MNRLSRTIVLAVLLSHISVAFPSETRKESKSFSSGFSSSKSASPSPKAKSPDYSGSAKTSGTGYGAYSSKQSSSASIGAAQTIPSRTPTNLGSAGSSASKSYFGENKTSPVKLSSAGAAPTTKLLSDEKVEAVSSKIKFGSFGARPPQSADPSPRNSDSALSRGLDSARSQANALKTFDARTAVGADASTYARSSRQNHSESDSVRDAQNSSRHDVEHSLPVPNRGYPSPQTTPQNNSSDVLLGYVLGQAAGRHAAVPRADRQDDYAVTRATPYHDDSPPPAVVPLAPASDDSSSFGWTILLLLVIGCIVGLLFYRRMKAIKTSAQRRNYTL